ncbi:MAG: hypothetical protein ACQ9ET_00720 [Nitrosomonadaceae bacterium]
MAFNDLWVKLGLKDDQFKKGLSGAQKRTSAFSRQMNKLGGVVAAAFATDQIIKFASEVLSLGGKAQGITAAFEELDDGSLLDDLRSATRGTVDDLTLMQKAVQANNFKIPLDKLATFFEFATKRAIQTGESVDYLVESIITGIGRKSVLVMDNLGISASELQEEVKKVGDFGRAAGNIIEQELTKMGEVTSTATTGVEKFQASWTNLKTEIGESVAPTVSAFMESISSFIDGIDKKQVRGGILSNAIKEDQKEIEAMASKFMEVGAEQDKNNARLRAANLLRNQYQQLLKANLSLTITERQEIFKQLEAIENYKSKIGEVVPVKKELTEEQKEELEKQRKINTEVERKIALELDLLGIIKQQGESRKKQADEAQKIADAAKEASLVEFEFDEEQEDPFPYLSKEAVEGRKERAQEMANSLETLQGVMLGFGENALAGLGEAQTGFQRFAQGMGETVLKLLSIFLSQSISQAIAGATASGAATGPAAVFTTPAFIATAVGGVLSAFAAIPKFEAGGIIPGSSYYGDNVLGRFNSGEMVLNSGQQSNLFKMINNPMGGGGQLTATVTGEQIQFVLDRNNKRRGQAR